MRLGAWNLRTIRFIEKNQKVFRMRYFYAQLGLVYDLFIWHQCLNQMHLSQKKKQLISIFGSFKGPVARNLVY
jgi:hypothetical protein